MDVVRQNIRKICKLLDSQKATTDRHFKTDSFLIISKKFLIAKYNAETDLFESPTLAINFGTLLKECWYLAYIKLIQIDKTNDQRKNLKILR